MRRQNKILLLFVTTLLLAVLLYGCGLPSDGGGPQILPHQTEILEVRVQPDTVAPADTASITCVITDSTDTRFKFYWVSGDGKVLGAKLIDGGLGSDYEYGSGSSPSIKWIAPDKSDTYSFLVSVDNGSSDSTSVNQNFSVIVK